MYVCASVIPVHTIYYTGIMRLYFYFIIFIINKTYSDSHITNLQSNHKDMLLLYTTYIITA